MSEPKNITPFVSIGHFPVSLAVIVSIVAAFIILVVGLAIGGAYLIALHAVDVNLATQHALQAREATSQARSALSTCQALVSMDNAKDGIHFSKPTATGTAELYVTRFVGRLDALVKATKCSEVIKKYGGK